MGKMKNAPLIYTVGMIQFPRIPNIENFIDPFLESVRKDYPLDDSYIAPTFMANIGPEGIKMKPHQENKLWQFSSIDRKWSIVLSNHAIFLHTSSYHDFSSFIEKFRFCVTALNRVPHINIRWMTSIGIRYVNLIASAGKEQLSDYIESWVLPENPPGTSLEIIQGIHIGRYKTECGELRLQALHNPPFTLPPELSSPFVVKNGWIRDKPVSEFALVDLDHGTTWEAYREFNVNNAMNQLSSLRKVSRSVFDLVVTDKAMKLWRK